MAVFLSPVGGVAAQFFDNSGNVLTGGKLYTYSAGTTTPVAAYTSSLGNVAWSNPIVLDASGRVSGSGEIWLTDGVIYKFVLKDSNDVLIATYDNITGINSNFVNFTTGQEIQTATAGQTVFNLTTVNYTPGTNSLTVYVDGVNQYGPGAQYSYEETDSTTVTFNDGLHVGASVKFTTATQTTGNATDASVVAYDPPFVGGVPTNVEDKLAQYVSVKDFGAVGDWDATTETGTDDTTAIQAAIDYVLSLPDPRNGGTRGIFFPPGNYKITSLTIQQIGFGFAFEGAGQNVSQIWSDYNDPNPAIDCQIEFTRFSNLTLSGSLQATYDPTKWKPVFFKGKLGNNYADIDVKFEQCNLFGFNTFAAIYGRGCVIDNCSIVYGFNVIEVVCSPDTDLTIPDPFGIWGVETGMRHYTIRDSRFDSVSKAVFISGTAPQKDYINEILIANNDFLGVDRVIQSSDCTIQGANITGNVSLQSFRFGVVDVPNVKRCQDVGNIWQANYKDSTVPSNDNETIEFVWKCEEIDHLTISGTTVKNLAKGVVYAGTLGVNIAVIGCSFPNAYEWKSGFVNAFFVNSPNSIPGLALVGNTFSCRNINGSNFLFNPVQASVNTRCFGNVAPWLWAGNAARLAYTPVVKVNGVATAGTGSSFGRYSVDDNYVYVDVAISTTIPELSGDISITLPVPAVPEFPGFSPSYSGTGEVADMSNVVTTTYLDNFRVVGDTDETFITASTTTNTTKRNMNVSDIANPANPFVFVGSFKYTWQ